MPYVELPGVNLWYTDSGGDGVPLVLLHAASGTSDSWVYQLPAFSGAGYRCIAPDRRGWGRSKPNATGQQPGCASEDVQGLAQHLGLDRFHLIGTAAGCAVAVDYALSYPDRLRSLVLSDGTGGVRDPEYLELHQRMRPPEIEALPIELREVSPRYRGENPQGLQRWIEIAHASGEASAPRQTSKNHITLAALESLRMPVLAIAGDADITTPPALMRRYVQRIPNCQFHLIPEAGHAAFWEEPETWNNLVLDFIGR
jgi:pimeloyl-ACP methyl ester carboxylesterase